MKIAIMGTGGLGSYIGGRMAYRGQDVTFISRGKQLEALKTTGLKIDSPDGSLHLSNLNVTDDCSTVGPVDLIIFCVKSYDTAEAAEQMRDDPPDLVIVATGVLTLSDGTGPERTYKRLDGAAMSEVFALNTIGPALIAKHMLALLPRDRRSVFAALSARVGSISDNMLGGWHSYRASKSALNMLLKNFAIELGRTHDEAVIVGLHPGTVNTALSEPFQSGLQGGQLTEPADAAENLLRVVDRLRPAHSGKVFDWKGEEVPT